MPVLADERGLSHPMPRGVAMIPYERHERIIRHLQETGLAKITELADVLPGVSVSTLRRDLKELESQGKIEHLAGGAVKMHAAAHEVNISTKDTQHGAEKGQIARLASSFVRDGDTVYVDSGSTCSVMLPMLLDRSVTIYTTSGAASFVKGDVQAELYVVGGLFNPVTMSFTGSMTEEELRDLYFDRAFLGANAVDEQRGVMTPGFSEAAKKRIVRANSAKTYVLVDSSKFHEFSNVRVFGLEGIELISERTDEKIARCVRLITPQG